MAEVDYSSRLPTVDRTEENLARIISELNEVRSHFHGTESVTAEGIAIPVNPSGYFEYRANAITGVHARMMNVFSRTSVPNPDAPEMIRGGINPQMIARTVLTPDDIMSIRE